MIESFIAKKTYQLFQYTVYETFLISKVLFRKCVVMKTEWMSWNWVRSTDTTTSNDRNLVNSNINKEIENKTYHKAIFLQCRWIGCFKSSHPFADSRHFNYGMTMAFFPFPVWFWWRCLLFCLRLTSQPTFLLTWFAALWT